MEVRNFHLFFHPMNDQREEYRLECIGGLTKVGNIVKVRPKAIVTVSPSKRLRTAIEEYHLRFEQCVKKYSIEQEDHDMLNLLTAWIGRLLWDNFFTSKDGRRNVVGDLLLNTFEVCQSERYIFRMMLHLGRMNNRETLMRAPWPCLLFRFGEKGESYKTFFAQAGVHLSYYWPSPSVKKFSLADKKQIDLLLTSGGGLTSHDPVLKVLKTIKNEIDVKRTDSIFRLSRIGELSFENLNGSETLEADVWIHIGHGEIDSESGIPALTIIGADKQVRLYKPYSISLLQSRINVPIVILMSCSVASPGPNVSTSVVRSLLQSAQHVIGFTVPVEQSLAAKFIAQILSSLEFGKDIETAVHDFYTDPSFIPRKPDSPHIPIPWQASLPTIHTRSEEPPPEYNLLDQKLESELPKIFEEAIILRERHKNEESIDNLDFFIQPAVEHGILALTKIRDMTGLSGDSVSAQPTLLMGNAGMGKTFFLHYLFDHLFETVNQDKNILPILIPFIYLDEARKKAPPEFKDKIHIMIAQVLRNYQSNYRMSESNGGDKKLINRANAIERLINKGRLLVILDGLDEVANLNDIYALRQWSQFLYPLFTSPNSRIIVSCRTELAEQIDIKRLFAKGEVTELRPWDENRVREYIENIARYFGIPEVLWQKLLQWGGKILSTPLFAHFSAGALKRMRETQDWSQTITMEELVNKWANRESIKISHKIQIERDSLIELACHAAHKLSIEYAGRVYLRELIDDVNSSLQERSDEINLEIKKNTLNLLSVHSLMIIENGQYVKFAHPLFRSYFSAKFIVNKLDRDTSFDRLLQYTPIQDEEFIQQFSVFLTDLIFMSKEDRSYWSRELKRRFAKLTDKSGFDDSENWMKYARLCTYFILPICSFIEYHTNQNDQKTQVDDFIFKNLKFISSKIKQLRISNITFEKCFFDQTTFRESLFSGINFLNCNISRCDMDSSQPDLNKNIFNDCTFKKTNLEHNIISDVSFENCQILDCSLMVGHEESIDSIFENCNFTNTKFKQNNFFNDPFRDGKISNCTFEGNKYNFKHIVPISKKLFDKNSLQNYHQDLKTSHKIK